MKRNVFTLGVMTIVMLALSACGYIIEDQAPQPPTQTPEPTQAYEIVWLAPTARPTRVGLPTGNPNLTPGPALPLSTEQSDVYSATYRPKWQVVCIDSLTLRGAPRKESVILGYYVRGDKVLASELADGYTYTGKGWVFSQYLCKTDQPAGW